MRDGITEYNGVNAQRGGFKETWSRNSTIGGIERANSTDFPAFNAVKDFTPIVAGKSWYVPGVGDWALALKVFGIENPEAGYKTSGYTTHLWGKATTQGLGYKYQEMVFKQAEGEPLTDWYWTANQWDAGGETAITLTAGPNGVFFGGAKIADRTLVRPFIKY